MTEIFVVSAVRSPITRRRGPLSEVHPVDLMAEVLGGAVERAGLDPAVIDIAMKRFGLTYVDFRTQKRTVKDSGLWYGRVAAANRLDV